MHAGLVAEAPNAGSQSRSVPGHGPKNNQHAPILDPTEYSGQDEAQKLNVGAADLLVLRQQIREDMAYVMHDLEKGLTYSWSYWWDQVLQQKLMDMLNDHHNAFHLHAAKEIRCAVDAIVGQLSERCTSDSASHRSGEFRTEPRQETHKNPMSFQPGCEDPQLADPVLSRTLGTSSPPNLPNGPNTSNASDMAAAGNDICFSQTSTLPTLVANSRLPLELNSQIHAPSAKLANLREKAGKVLKGELDSHEDLTLRWLRQPVITQSSKTLGSSVGASSFLQSIFKPLVDNSVFDGISCLIILANAVFAGVFMQMKLQAVKRKLLWGGEDAKKENDEMDPAELFAYIVVEYVFNGLFFAEFSLRVLAHGRSVRISSRLSWLLFDAVLLVACIIDMSLGSQDGNSIVLLFRLARVVRIFRVLRPIKKMSIFRDLRMIVIGTFKSIRTLLWACVCLFVTLYVFSIVFLEGVYGYFLDYEHTALLEDEQESYSGLLDHFGSVDMSMLSLFMAVSGGLDWEGFWRSLVAIGPFYGYMFVVYIMITLHGLLNVVTGIFVDSAMLVAKNDQHLATQEDHEARKHYITHMRRILEEADKDGSGTISWQEFSEHCADEKLQRYFRMWGLDVAEAKHIFHILDDDGLGEVSIDDFLSGCFRLKGEARKLDMTLLMYENKRMTDKWARFVTYSMQEFEHIKRSVDSLSARWLVASEGGPIDMQDNYGNDLKSKC